MFEKWQHFLKESKQMEDFYKKFKVFLVGGSVRDSLLNRASHDADYVVVGATPQDMLDVGFSQVGAEFPVFIHPKTGDEYALARSERKSGEGHKGFTTNTEDIPIEKDLERRDLTINALARMMLSSGEYGDIVDPYGGKKDIENKLLRHVSEAFEEDPLRVLRVARFAAQLDFSAAPETEELMSNMVGRGMLDSLTPERIWKETEKALSSDRPDKYFEVLAKCGALDRFMPELSKLRGVPQPQQYHGENDAWMHTMAAVRAARSITSDPEIIWAVVNHDLGKGATSKDVLPHHYGHEMAGIPLVKAANERLKVPSSFSDLAEMSTENHMRVHIVKKMRPEKVVDLLYRTDAFRKPERFEKFLRVSEADARSHKGREFEEGDFIRNAFEVCRKVSAKELVDQGFVGKQIGEKLRQNRIAAYKNYLRGENK